MIKKHTDPPDKYMCAIKNTLINMCGNKIDSDPINIIKDAVSRVSKIVFHTYNFLNLYFLHCFNNDFKFPIIDEKFINAIMLTVSKRIDNRGPKPKNNTLKLMNKLKSFFDKYYLLLLTDQDIVSNDKLTQILLYEAKDIVKNINNNISQHYIQHVHKFINIQFNVKFQINKIRYNKELSASEKKLAIKSINLTYSKIKNDILNPIHFADMELLSDEKFHYWIGENKHLITPCKIKYLKDSIHYDVKANPQNYIKEMFTINQKIATINKNIQKE